MMYVGFVWVCALLLRISSAHYTQQWAIHISGGKHVADKVATDHGFVNLGDIFPEYYHFSHRGVAKRSARPHDGHRVRLAVDERVHWAKQQKAKSRKKRDFKLLDSDPRWPSMWYLNRGNGLDMNVIPAWLEGITGKGAVVTILDDGLEKDHPDLIQNYDPLASYDVNSHDSDPSPRYDMIDSNRHGTRCAGEVAATSNNSVCALGIAHGAQVGGVRMLDGDVTDAVEARSLSLNPQHIDIYSASWGPDDDGKTVDGPGELATRAFVEGVTKGRGGKGSIFVWASGNGGRDHDNCNCDGYTNSIYSLSISSATEQGHVPWYSEACSSTLASTYSSGALGERQVITTDLHHSCTNSHTGTSASAPLAAGICALTLQANPSLTWRDMQHIVVRTARPGNLIAADWQTNGVGRNVSHSFGYGLMDAYAMVKLAKKWVTVPEQYRCEITAPQVDKLVPAKSVVVLKLPVTECKNVEILEHVQAKLSIYAQRRGDLHIQLTSPMGTKVTLLAHRLHDTSRLGFNHWPFMSVHSWGESPFGTWQLEIHNDGRLLGRATLQNWSLILYGTKKFPSDSSESFSVTNAPKLKTTSLKKVKMNKKQKNKTTTQKPITTRVQKLKPPNHENLNTRPKKKPQKLKQTNNHETTISPYFYTFKTNDTKPAGGDTNENVSKIPQVFQKYSKFQHIYPAIFPLIDNVKSRDSYVAKQMQKQKEISRDLNPSRNVKFVKNTVEITTPIDMTTDAKKFTADAELLKWELILHGTETLPTVDAIPVPIPKVVSTMPKMVSTSTIVDVDHNSIDDNDNWKITSQIHDEGMVESQFQKTTVDHNANSSSCVRSNSSICLGLCLAVTFLLRLHMLIINDCGVLRQSILHTIANAFSYAHSTITNVVQYCAYNTVNTMQYLFNTVQSTIGNTAQYLYNTCTEFTIHSFLLLINAIAFIYNRIKTSLTLLLVSIPCCFEFQLLLCKQKLHNEKRIIFSTLYSNKSRDITNCIRRIFHHFPIRITVGTFIQRILCNQNETYIVKYLPCSRETNHHQPTYRRRFKNVFASFLSNWFNKSVPCVKS